MYKIYYNKLIRDKIPQNIKAKGQESQTRKLTTAEFKNELLKKIAEEALGVSRSKSRKILLSELADLLIVIGEVKKVHKIKAVELRSVIKNNYKLKGGFKRKLYLIWSSDGGYKSNESVQKRRRK